MIGLEKYCTQFLGTGLTAAQSRRAKLISRAVLTGHLRTLIYDCSTIGGLTFGQATMLWMTRLGWRKLPLLVVPDVAAQDKARTNLRNILGKEQGKPKRVSRLDDSQVVALSSDLPMLTRQMEDETVVNADFVVAEGFTAKDADKLAALPGKLKVKAGVLLGNAELVTALAGRGNWILA